MFCIIRFIVAVIGCGGIDRLLFFQGIADTIDMGEGELEIIRPSGMTGDDHRLQPSVQELLFQIRKGSFGKLVILRECVDKAVTAIRAKPQGFRVVPKADL